MLILMNLHFEMTYEFNSPQVSVKQSCYLINVQSMAEEKTIIPLGPVSHGVSPETRFSWVSHPPQFSLNFTSGQLFLHSNGTDLT